MFTLLPVMNIVPPLYVEKLSSNDDFSIEALSPVRQIAPPLEWEVPALIPLLSSQVMLYILPLSPSQ